MNTTNQTNIAIDKKLTLELLQAQFEDVEGINISTVAVADADTSYNLLYAIVPATDIALNAAVELLLHYPAVSVCKHSKGLTLYFKENQPEGNTYGFSNTYRNLFKDLVSIFYSAVVTNKFYCQQVYRTFTDGKERPIDQFTIINGKDFLVRFVFYDENNYAAELSECRTHPVLCELEIDGKTFIDGEFQINSANEIATSLMQFIHELLNYWEINYRAVKTARYFNLDLAEASLALSKLR